MNEQLKVKVDHSDWAKVPSGPKDLDGIYSISSLISRPRNYSELGRNMMSVEPLEACSFNYYSQTDSQETQNSIDEALTDEKIIEIARLDMERYWNDANFDTEDEIRFNRELDVVLNEYINKGSLVENKSSLVKELTGLISRWSTKKPKTQYHPVTKEKIPVFTPPGEDEKYLRRLKSDWTFEPSNVPTNDYAAFLERKHLQEQLTHTLAAEINQEIDREIISDLKKASYDANQTLNRNDYLLTQESLLKKADLLYIGSDQNSNTSEAGDNVSPDGLKLYPYQIAALDELTKRNVIIKARQGKYYGFTSAQDKRRNAIRASLNKSKKNA